MGSITDSAITPGTNAVANEMTLTAGLTYNLFQVTGVVRVNFIYGIVTTALPAAVTAARLELFPAGGAPIPITLAAGTDISAAPTGSVVSKTNLAGVALTYSNSTLGLFEDAAGLVFTTCVIGQQTGGIDTYIRFARAGAGASGVIYWRAEWVPLSIGAGLVAV